MNHLPREAEILAHRLAEARGISLEEAIIAALNETLQRIPDSESRQSRVAEDDFIRQVREISTRYRALPLLDPRSPDEILGYDEFGLPT